MGRAISRLSAKGTKIDGVGYHIIYAYRKQDAIVSTWAMCSVGLYMYVLVVRFPIYSCVS